MDERDFVVTGGPEPMRFTIKHRIFLASLPGRLSVEYVWLD